MSNLAKVAIMVGAGVVMGVILAILNLSIGFNKDGHGWRLYVHDFAQFMAGIFTAMLAVLLWL